MQYPLFESENTGLVYQGRPYNVWRVEEFALKGGGLVRCEIHFWDRLEDAQNGKGAITERLLEWIATGGTDAQTDGIEYLLNLENYTTRDNYVITLKGSVQV